MLLKDRLHLSYSYIMPYIKIPPFAICLVKGTQSMSFGLFLFCFLPVHTTVMTTQHLLTDWGDLVGTYIHHINIKTVLERL